MSFVEQHHQHSDEQLLLPDNHAAVIHALLEPHSDTTQAPAQAHFLERICSLKLESYSHFPKDALREFIAELVTEVEVLSAPPTAQLFMLLGELGLMAAAEEDDEDASAVDTLLAWPPFRSKVLRWAITAAAGEESDASLRLASAIIPVLDAGVEEDSGLSPESIGLWMATASQLVSCVINLQKARYDAADELSYEGLVIHTLAFLSRALIVENVETADIEQHWNQLLRSAIFLSASCQHYSANLISQCLEWQTVAHERAKAMHELAKYLLEGLQTDPALPSFQEHSEREAMIFNAMSKLVCCSNECWHSFCQSGGATKLFEGISHALHTAPSADEMQYSNALALFDQILLMDHSHVVGDSLSNRAWLGTAIGSIIQQLVCAESRCPLECQATSVRQWLVWMAATEQTVDYAELAIAIIISVSDSCFSSGVDCTGILVSSCDLLKFAGQEDWLHLCGFTRRIFDRVSHQGSNWNLSLKAISQLFQFLDAVLHVGATVNPAEIMTVAKSCIGSGGIELVFDHIRSAPASCGTAVSFLATLMSAQYSSAANWNDRAYISELRQSRNLHELPMPYDLESVVRTFQRTSQPTENVQSILLIECWTQIRQRGDLTEENSSAILAAVTAYVDAHDQYTTLGTDHFSFLCRMLCLYISVASKHHARERNYGQFGHWMSEMDWTLQSVPVVTRTTVIPWFFDYASTRTEPIAVPAIALCKWMKLRLQQKDGMEDDEGGETHEHIDASLFSCASAVSLAVAGLDRYVKDASADDGMWANIKFLQECAERSKNKYVIMMTGISLFRRTLLAAADPESTIYRSVATGGCDQSTFLLATFNLMFSLLNDHAQAEASSLSFGDNAVAFLGNAATIVQNVGKHGGSTFEFTYGFDSAGSALQILDKALQLINMITTTANCDQRGTGSVASSLRPDGCVRGLRSFHSAVHQALVQLTRLPKDALGLATSALATPCCLSLENRSHLELIAQLLGSHNSIVQAMAATWMATSCRLIREFEVTVPRMMGGQPRHMSKVVAQIHMQLTNQVVLARLQAKPLITDAAISGLHELYASRSSGSILCAWPSQVGRMMRDLVFPHLVATIGAFVESASASPEFTAATGSMTAAMTLESVSDVLATCNPPTVRLGLGADIHTAVRYLCCLLTQWPNLCTKLFTMEQCCEICNCVLTLPTESAEPYVPLVRLFMELRQVPKAMGQKVQAAGLDGVDSCPSGGSMELSARDQTAGYFAKVDSCVLIRPWLHA